MFEFGRLGAMVLALVAGGSVVAKPSVHSVEPSLVRWGHTEEVTVEVDGWAQGTQVAAVPGGAYLSRRFSLQAPTAAAAAAGLTWVATRDLVGYSAEGPVARYDGLQVKALAGDGKWLYGATADALVVIEADRPEPRQVASLPLEGLDALAAGAEHLCAVAGQRLVMVNIAKPTEPLVIGDYALGEKATGVAVQGESCIVAGPLLGVLRVDKGRRGLQATAVYRSDHGTWQVASAGERVYLADGDTGLTILASGTDGFKWLGSYNKLGHVVRVAAEDERVLVADDLGVLSLFDVSRPDTPTLVAGYRLPHTPKALAYTQGVASAITEDGVMQVDLSAETPPPLSTIGVNLGGSRRSDIVGDVLYVADWFSGLHLYDISQPHLPRLISSFHTPGSPKGVLVRDGMAFVADDDHGLQVVDVRDPKRPRQVANLPLEGLAYTMKRVGDILYLASHRGGFHIVDIANPKAPRRLGGFDTPGKSWALEVVGRHLFVADDNSGLLVFDVADPSAPTQVAAFDAGGQAEDVVIRDGLAYVTFFDRGLFVLDVRDPRKPRQISHLPTPGNARGIVLRNDLAYIADWKSGVQILNIADPKQPRIIGHYDTKGAAWGVALDGEHLYVLDWWGGLRVLDVSEPERPRRVGHYHDRGRIHDLAVRGNYAFVAAGASGLQVFDVKNVLNPVWTTGVDLDGHAVSVDVVDERAYVAAGEGGLAIVDVRDPFHSHWFGGLDTLRAARVRVAGNTAYVLTAEGDVAVVSVLDARHPRKLAVFPGPFSALEIIDEKTLVLGKGQEWVAMSVENLSLVGRVAGRTLENPVAFLEVADGVLFVHEQGRGVHLYRLNDRFRKAAFFALNETLTGMTASEGRLFLGSEASGLLAVDVSAPEAPRLEAVYATTDRIGSLAVRGDGVFLAGESRIVSGQLLQPMPVERNGSRLRIVVPKGTPMGAYHLLFKRASGETLVHHNAFKVGLAKPAKPKFTMEDLKRVLEQKNFEGKAP